MRYFLEMDVLISAYLTSPLFPLKNAINLPSFGPGVFKMPLTQTRCGAFLLYPNSPCKHLAQMYLPVD